ncbi:MAG: VWA domain-containing protein [Desulfovibrio sp.]|jgi:serine/threonine-protein kinase PpkA|nr:VWA domain-containing protein [Desulfovibrio sp.]
MFVRLSVALCGLVLMFSAPAFGAERRPLLQDGKKTLYQRVVTHPGAEMRAAPSPGAELVQERVRTFSVFYVFGRSDGYLEVGPSSSAPDGWIRESDATFWPQAVTMLFTDRGGRGPVLFFKDEKSLTDVCAAEDMRERLRLINARMSVNRNGQAALPDFPVIAAEPSDAEGAVSAGRFYLMPVKGMAEPFAGTKFLEVASIDPEQIRTEQAGAAGEERAALPTGALPTGVRPSGVRPSMGVAFVIDSTISMRLYIEESLNVVRSAFDSIEKHGLGADVGFAVVAFRSNMQDRPALEYLTRKICDFTKLSDRKTLEIALSGVKEAKVSTHDFDEDSMAGIKAAVDGLDWEGYDARVIVLITDAGPLRPGDPLASAPMLPTEMRDYARTKNIRLTVCHILSPRGETDQDYAAGAYRELTSVGGGLSSYMAIHAPDSVTGVGNFSRTAEQLAAGLIGVLRDVGKGFVGADGKDAGQVKGKDAEQAEEAFSLSAQEAHARRIGESIGYAAYLDFLGKTRVTRSPRLVNAWIADMDLALLADGRYVPAVEAAVLITKNQLSDLQLALKIIVDNAERTKKTDARDFFQSILAASAQMARDPAAFSAGRGQSIMETGVLGELLEGLPYKSDVMLLREDDWYRMSIGEQTFFINRLKSRISRYEEYDLDVSAWEGFGAPNSGDWTCRMPLNILP